jgi:hypothetical protein
MGQAPQDTFPDVKPVAAVPHSEVAATPVATPPAPAQAATAPSGTTPTRRRRPATLSINGGGTKEAANTAATATATPVGNEAFDIAHFLVAWKRVQSLHPSELLLVNAMRNGKLDMEGDTHVTFTVESELIRDSINAKLPQLMSELRTILRNDSLTFNVVLDKATSSINTMTDAEILDAMRKDNPYIDDFLRDFGMKMI